MLWNLKWMFVLPASYANLICFLTASLVESVAYCNVVYNALRNCYCPSFKSCTSSLKMSLSVWGVLSSIWILRIACAGVTVMPDTLRQNLSTQQGNKKPWEYFKMEQTGTSRKLAGLKANITATQAEAVSCALPHHYVVKFSFIQRETGS